MKPLIRKSFFAFSESMLAFWERYPALYFGFFFALGIACTFNLIYSIFALPFINYKNFFKSIFLLFTSTLYFILIAPPTLSSPAHGSGVFQVHAIKPYASPFTTGLVYEGLLKKFYTDAHTFSSLPCRIYINQTKNRPLAHQEFLIPKGSLEEISPYHYVLKPEKKSAWVPLKKKIFFAEKRFLLKQSIKKVFLKKWYKDRRSRALLETLVTGEANHRLLAYQFNMLGLSHLLSISGFHFALICTLLLCLLKPFMPLKAARISALSLLLLYFFYMGNSPSVNRAWVGISLYLIGTLFEARPSALNMLGGAFLCALIINPLSLFQIGFQLSYAATLGILLFFSYFEDKLRLFLPKRTFEETLCLKTLDKWGYLVAAYLRKTLALSGAVLTFLLPLILFHFHHFPLISLAYNLFFPLLFSLLIPLFLIALIAPPLHTIVALYANFLLDLVEYAPKKLMFYVSVPEFSVGILLVVLILVLSFGIKVWGDKECFFSAK